MVLKSSDERNLSSQLRGLLKASTNAFTQLVECLDDQRRRQVEMYKEWIIKEASKEYSKDPSQLHFFACKCNIKSVLCFKAAEVVHGTVSFEARSGRILVILHPFVTSA